jgi:hypothetical protein
MSALDREVLAEKLQVVRRHLARVADRLPADASAHSPQTLPARACGISKRLLT